MSAIYTYGSYKPKITSANTSNAKKSVIVHWTKHENKILNFIFLLLTLFINAKS